MHPLERIKLYVEDEGKTIAHMLANKAENSDLQRLNAGKANKEDFEDIKDSIKTLDGQMRAVIVMLNESIKLQVPVPSEAVNAKIAKIRALISQMDAIGTWASKNAHGQEITVKHSQDQKAVHIFDEYLDYLKNGANQVSLTNDKQLEDAKEALKKSLLETKLIGRQRYQSAIRQKNLALRNRTSQATTSVDMGPSHNRKASKPVFNATRSNLMLETTQTTMSKGGFAFSPLSFNDKDIFSQKHSLSRLSKQISTGLKL